MVPWIVERENVQKRTFTRWINLHLEKCSPPLEVKDLLVDIKDGKILMALLEVLSGQNLLHEYKPSTHRIFRLNNIAKALKFLEDSNVKLVSIDAAEIADGNSSMILGLIWNIILFFQIKELTGNLNRNSSSSSLSSGPSGPDSDTSHPSTPNVERSMSISVKDQRKAIKALLTWVQRKTRKYGIAVQDFASSWRSGIAFLAVVKAIDSSLVDMKQALEKTPKENLEDAFNIAQDQLGIPRLLEPEDIMVESPDEQSIVTYVAQFLEHFPELEGEDFSDADKEFQAEPTYVHVKETPGDAKQEKVLILNENGEHTYTPDLDRSHSPPPKIHILSLPLDQENQNFHMAHEELHNNQDHPEILTGEPQRPSSLPIPEPTGFQSSPNTDIITKNVNKSDGNQRRMSDPLKQNEDLPPTVLMYRTHSLEPVDSEESKPTSETKETLERRTRSLPWNSHPPKNVPEHPTKDLEFPISGSQEEESAHKYVLQMLNEEISKFPENPEYAKQMSDKNKTYASCQETDEPDFRDTSEAPCPSECFSLTIRNTPKSLDITNEDGSMAMKAPNSSKVSVIPHDLFYYPHYDVPISEVLNAFASPNQDLDPDPSLSENNKICAEIIVNCLAEKETHSLNFEEDISKPTLHTKTKDEPAAADDKELEKQKKESHSHKKSSLNKTIPAGKNVCPKANSNISSTQTNSGHPDIPVIVVNQFDTAAEERKLPEERSKKKEKRKNKAIFQGENAQSPKAGSTRLLDKQEEEPVDYQGLSRISHSDPNVFQRYVSDSSSKENDSTDLQRSTGTSESTSPSVRKRKDPETKEAPEKSSSHISTSRSDQPELFYFIIFLWVLVYCLLLLPQLVSSRH
ncbi:calmin isoform X3 [Sceloporus undulatus]|uniref:calmin isoform X3 n=1 Tax=Sceloporus undulatus TaxID=8520 RepID=UPI001C4D056B|nr:calmin isoform X3 [Sceloporus undulatus]